MLHRKRVVQSKIVAALMDEFFWTLKKRDRLKPDLVAKNYGKLLWSGASLSVVNEKQLRRSRFHICLSTDSINQNFNQLTKRATLISDTLLLSSNWAGEYYLLGDGIFGNGELVVYGMNCPNLAGLGQWILDAEPLLKAGLAFYLPSYSASRDSRVNGKVVRRAPDVKPKQVKAIDYLIRDGRAVDASGAEPIKSQLVRPVLYTELPFIEGVSLRQFSEITIEEFSSYSGFRDFLRQSFLEMDSSLNSVQSERELVKLSLQINDHIRSVRSEMVKARRRRAVSVSGATIGSLGAILVAVYGPALAAAIAAIGASGGVWSIIHAATENSTRTLREDKWYYVWVLAKESNLHAI
jgi:hypothetical protein